ANIAARRLCVALTTAGFHARRLSRNLPIADADHDDFQQIILIAILTRSSRYDERLGQWPTFVNLLARHAVADTARTCRRRLSMEPFNGAEENLPDPAECNPELRLDIRATFAALPHPFSKLIELVAETGSLAAAQRASAMSAASFYRRIHELRLLLLIGGLPPPGRRSSAFLENHRPVEPV